MDLFGDANQFPQRPDTADFWRLSEIILQMDGAMDEARTEDEKEAVWSKFILEHVSGDAIYYLGFQRACRALGVSTVAGVQQHQEEIVRITTLYSEAFAVGVQYEKRGGRP